MSGFPPSGFGAVEERRVDAELHAPGGPLDPAAFTSRRSRLLQTPQRQIAASWVSTVVVLGALVALFFLAPGSAAFRHAFLSPHAMWQSIKGDPANGYYSVPKALLLNIEMFAIAECCILVLGLAIALIRLSTSPVALPFRILTTVYVDLFRGVPMLLVILAIGTGIPTLGLGFISNQSAFVYGTVSLVLGYSAYVSEVYRAGVLSVPLGQVAASRSLGLSRWTSLRHVVLPQAIRTIIPPLLNDFVALQKDTALVSTLGVIEANRAAEIYAGYAFNYSSFTIAAILFILLTIPLARFTDHLIARDRSRRLAQAPA